MQTQEIIDSFKSIIVQISTAYGTGTGFYVKDFGVIVTNVHVVRETSEAVISGKLIPQTVRPVLFYDFKYDLAFIRVPEGTELPCRKIYYRFMEPWKRIISCRRCENGQPFRIICI